MSQDNNEVNNSDIFLIKENLYNNPNIKKYLESDEQLNNYSQTDKLLYILDKMEKSSKDEEDKKIYNSMKMELLKKRGSGYSSGK